MTYLINAFGHVYRGRFNLLVNRLVGDVHSILAALAHEGSDILWFSFERIRVARLNGGHRLVCNPVSSLNERCQTDLQRFCVLVCGRRETLGGGVGLPRKDIG